MVNHQLKPRNLYWSKIVAGIYHGSIWMSWGHLQIYSRSLILYQTTKFFRLLHIQVESICRQEI